MFSDPFVFHAVRAWLNPCKDPFNQQVLPALNNPDWAARLTEACAITHYWRKFPTYYIKAEGEIDIAYIDKNRFWPVEIKGTKQLRPKKLKQISKYPNSLVLTRSNNQGKSEASQPCPYLLRSCVFRNIMVYAKAQREEIKAESWKQMDDE